MTTIYVTPYVLASKTCQSVSSTLPAASTVSDAATLLAPAGSSVVSRSDRLILIDLDGTNGLALSDLPYA